MLALLLLLCLPAGAGAQPVDPSEHWPMPPAELEQHLSQDDFRILSVRGGVGGVMGVKKLQIALLPSGKVLDVKWKKAPPGDADGWNNTPRKELAAYDIQKWFLDPADYVVPTIVVRCIPPETYRAIDPAARPTLEGSRCEMGALVIWIENVTVPKKLFEKERFESDPLYARHMSDFNLLTYLINHEDGREGNFLVSELDGERRIFSIDNGVAFGSKMKNFFVPNWNKLRVPALRKETVDRLRKVGPEQLEALGVLAELKANEDGVLQPVKPGPNRDPDRGSRVAPGWIQLGLTHDEIEDVKERIDSLLADVDAGRVHVY